MRRPFKIITIIALASAVSACAWIQEDLSKGVDYFGKDEGDRTLAVDQAASKVTAIGVNAYLWRAALDTISFMPLLQTDSSGGVIVTDWYSNPGSASERMKLTVSILDQDLRADAIRIAASRQINQNGQWVDAPVQAATVQKLEDIILTKARDLRRSAITG